ncbi:DUF1653 domain-containing protein [Patescibacteria group bacterium]|nr:DUF1653 domain-containing protein [Patescibacteria group bacterium]
MVAVGEKYTHYKRSEGNDHMYEIIAIGIFKSENAYDGEEVVIYKPLYLIEELPSYVSLLVRPRAEFEGELEYNGKTVKRFTLVS